MIKFGFIARMTHFMVASAAGGAAAPIQSSGLCSSTPSVFHPSRVCLKFDMKTYMMEKRKKQEMDRLNIAEEEEEDNMSMAGDEVNQQIDEEEEQRRRELQEHTERMLKEREAEEQQKKAKFKQWRAQQIQSSSKRKEAAHQNKMRGKEYRFIDEEVDLQKEKILAEQGAFKELEEDDVVQDADERRKERNMRASEAKDTDKIL